MNTKRFLALSGLLVFLFFIIVLFSGMRAQAQTDTCVSGRCHASLGKAKAVHPPVKDGMCTACHAVAQQSGKSKHPGGISVTLVQQGAELCSMCHGMRNTKKVVHAPIAGGDCTSCHDPHQSGNPGMLRQPVPALCFQCHGDEPFRSKVLHPPVMGGGCSNCHDNHQSDFPKRLNGDPKTLCFMCHPDKEEALKTRKAVHAPVRRACVSCHNPHGSNHKAMLPSDTQKLCGSCHPNQVLKAQKARMKHGPVASGSVCRTCHEPHAGDHKKLLNAREKELCLSCHDKEQRTSTGTLVNMKAFLEQNPRGHGPVAKGNCSACHDAHGSDYWRLLTRYYPADFYASYSDGAYALCFSCHSSAAFTQMTTKRATQFRDGDRNLHFVHVNKRAKGRTCKTCHEVHADTGQPKHLKDTVRFNGWKMPMNYVPSRNGGRCLPGCHGEKSYAR